MLRMSQLILAKQSAATTPILDGLILWYDAINNTGTGHSDSPSNWFDLSGNGNHGTLTSVTWEANSAVLDDISDRILTPVTLPTSGNFTVELVFKAAAGTGRKTLFSQHNGSSNTLFVARASSSLAAPLELLINSFTPVATGSVTIPEEQIAAMSFTRNGTRCRIYTNGNSDVSYTTSVALPNVPVRFGGLGNATYAFLGNMYSARIYNRALSPEEIAYNYAYDQATYPAS